MFSNSKFNGDISQWHVSNVTHMEHIFSQSAFTKDLSEWTPYGIWFVQKVFIEAKCPIPYWATITDENERKKTIQSYDLAKDLNNELNMNNNPSKKIKI
jgi:hypothetical protein